MNKFSVPLLTLLLSACAIGPDYQRPTIDLPEQWQTAKTADVDTRAWWAQFSDQRLQTLINESLNNNQDLKIAVANIEASAAALGLARTDFLPSVNAAISGARERYIDGSTDSIYQAGLLLDYEFDLWGRIRRANEAAAADLAADAFTRDALQNLIVAQVSNAYFQSRALDRRIALLERLQVTQRENLQLQQKRLQAGLIAAYDLEQARSEAYVVDAQLPALRAARVQTLTALAALRGVSPKAMTQAWQQQYASDVDASALPIAPDVPMDLPASLLERRPDIRAAEQRLVAANARIGEAKAAYFPRLSLTGIAGAASQALADLLDNSEQVWSAAATLSQPLTDIRRVGHRVDAAEARYTGADAFYQKTVQTAFQETLDALTSVDAARAIMQAQDQRVEALLKAYQAAQSRYRAGDLSYLELLDVERQLRAIEQEQVIAQLGLLQSTVDLYRALGGGWQSSADTIAAK